MQRDRHDLIVIDLAALEGSHRGQRCVVLGGGPALVEDIKAVRPLLLQGGVWIGVNQHALLLSLDYIVYQDKELWPLLKGHAPVISHHKDACDIWSGIVPDFGFSGGTAVWIAGFLGFDEIYVAGCDNYMTTRRYWHSKLGDLRVEDGISNIQAWVKVRDYMKEPQKVKVASGCLTKVFAPL